MYNVIKGNLLRGVDGQVNIVLTIEIIQSCLRVATLQIKIQNVQDFEYFRLKREGQRIDTRREKVMTWVKSNILKQTHSLFRDKKVL